MNRAQTGRPEGVTGAAWTDFLMLNSAKKGLRQPLISINGRIAGAAVVQRERVAGEGELRLI